MSDTPVVAAVAAESAEPKEMTGAETVAFVEAQKNGGGKPAPAKAPVAAPSIGDIAKEATRKYKVKVDGADHEVDEAELVRGYGHQRAANKILQEGKSARSQAEQFISMMKDPEQFYEAAKKMGHDPRVLAEKYLSAQLEDELMDPREKELKDTKAKLKHYDDLERKQLEQVEEKRHNELRERYQKDYETSFITALQESKLPPTKGMVAEMAKYISRSAKIGFVMSASEAAQLVKEDVQRSQLSLFGDSDGDTLLRLLGDEAANKILQARGAKVKSPEANLKTPETQGQPSERTRNNTKRMSPKEWRDFNRKR